jgi:aspartyl-tRNA synthetase
MITNITKLKLNKKQIIQGFVENIRDKQNICFLIIKDITGLIQITILKDKNPKFASLLEILTVQSVLTIKGTLVGNQNVKLNAQEFIPEYIKLESLSSSPLPLDDTSLIDQKIDYR